MTWRRVVGLAAAVVILGSLANPSWAVWSGPGGGPARSGFGGPPYDGPLSVLSTMGVSSPVRTTPASTEPPFHAVGGCRQNSGFGTDDGVAHFTGATTIDSQVGGDGAFGADQGSVSFVTFGCHFFVAYNSASASGVAVADFNGPSSNNPGPFHKTSDTPVMGAAGLSVQSTP